MVESLSTQREYGCYGISNFKSGKGRKGFFTVDFVIIGASTSLMLRIL